MAPDGEGASGRSRSGAPPILCVVGRKNAGKTTVTVALSGELNRRGVRVMTVKSGHGFQVDQPGKDSWRHRHEGGAIRTVLVGPGDFAVMGHWPGEPMNLREIAGRFLYDADIVLVEGAKESPEPRVEVFRKGLHDHPLFTEAAGGRGPTLALVTDAPRFDGSIPVFLVDDPEWVRNLADLVAEKLLDPEGDGS